MSEVKITENGFTEFLDDLEEYARAASDENLQKALMAGGEALAADVRKLPKPRRNISGITHMLDTVTAEPKVRRVQVGWRLKGYYGAFVEFGTRKMSAQPYLWPTWTQGKLRYYELIKQQLFRR